MNVAPLGGTPGASPDAAAPAAAGDDEAGRRFADMHQRVGDAGRRDGDRRDPTDAAPTTAAGDGADPDVSRTGDVGDVGPRDAGPQGCDGAGTTDAAADAAPAGPLAGALAVAAPVTPVVTPTADAVASGPGTADGAAPGVGTSGTSGTSSTSTSTGPAGVALPAGASGAAGAGGPVQGATAASGDSGADRGLPVPVARTGGTARGTGDTSVDTLPTPGAAVTDPAALAPGTSAVAPAAQAVSVPVPSASVVRAVTRQLEAPASELVRTGGEIELRLSPEQLGAVTLSCRIEDGRARLTLSAQRPATAEVLAESSRELSRMLREAGVHVEVRTQAAAQGAPSGWDHSGGGREQGRTVEVTTGAEPRSARPTRPAARTGGRRGGSSSLVDTYV